MPRSMPSPESAEYSRYSVYRIMTPTPVTIGPDTPAREALAIMNRKEIHHLPVTEALPGKAGEKVIGMVARGDLQRAISVFAGTKFENDRDRKTLEMKVKIFMSKNVVTVTPDTGIRESAQMLLDKDFNSAPVLEPGTGRLIGIVTSTDLLEFFCDEMGRGKRA